MVMLELDRVNIAVDGRPILHDLNLRIESGEAHVLFGPNRLGEPSLLTAIMGLPRYQVTIGMIRFQGQDLAGLSINERARLGVDWSIDGPQHFADCDSVSSLSSARARAIRLPSMARRSNCIGVGQSRSRRPHLGTMQRGLTGNFPAQMDDEAIRNCSSDPAGPPWCSRYVRPGRKTSTISISSRRISVETIVCGVSYKSEKK